MKPQIRRYTQDYPCLNLTALTKCGYLATGYHGEIKSTLHGITVWSLAWRATDSYIELYYSLPYKRDYQRTVKLIHQQAHYGGQRYYLECPTCGEKRKQLYIVSGEPACRLCHQLHYKSQSESPYERAGRKLDKLLTKVDNLGYRFDGYGRAKGQHLTTYREIDKTIHQLQQEICAYINQRFPNSFLGIF
ncbi:hypothetical protein [Vibrio marisflavi]|uniref:Uncharacterized protein n=1 Tax=Vibrio marisflavi CECT 7928 TaxID=634439 RepID=A0ABN8E0Z5_9VIBR|nr:hypothetical protein [Vibrio marisflavi]CAH0538570.1 hypothetical protein VMF7928_01492 [Vibrio marisflavi CECT 7928]